MSFLSLYRKYRPEDFNDLIGQDHVVKTLKNALKNDRVAHAYLFAGPRGTGKTSTAKVFAKALNCSNPGENLEPCGECTSCRRISEGSSLDVIEIDAASNRGIDEIRELREKVKFYPGEGQYKVYIIDEVHMLTKGAFNALLKTLEEPPDSVVFILATTEPHKVITTIISRCQRFDFSLLTLSDIKKRLKYIVEREGYEIETEALDILARNARGGMRDGISLLDQAISFTDGSLSSAEIGRMLGRISRDKLKQFLIEISRQNSQKALMILDEELESGLGIERLSDELVSYCRELLLVKECGVNSGILEYSAGYLDEISETASKLSSAEITDIIDEFAALKQKLRSSARPRLQLEISVIKLSSSSEASSLESRINELEYKLNNFINRADSDRADNIFKNESKSGGNTAQKTADEFEEIKKPEKSTAEEKEMKNKAEKTRDDKTNKSPQTIKDRENSSGGSAEKADPESKSPAKKTDAASSSDLSIKKVKKYWGSALNQIRKLDVSVQALLREGKPAAVEGNKIIVLFDEGKKFHHKGAVSNKSLIIKVLRNILNSNVDVEFVIGDYKKKSLNNDSTAENTAKKGIKNDNNVEERRTPPPKNRRSQNSRSSKSKKDFSKNTSSGEEELSIEEIARIFSGEIIEVDESILEKRGGS